MAEKHVSERSILLGRAHRIKLSERLRHSLEEIEYKQERLSMSRISSQSSKSGKELGRRVASTADMRQVSPKVKLLLQISDKLKASKHKLVETPAKKDKIEQNSPEVKKIQYSSDVKPRPKGGKLESMLKDIKRCNQMSTKAVSSIKKPFKNEQTSVGLRVSEPAIKVDRVEPKLGGIFSELLTVKEELRRVKQQNRLLVKLIEINQGKSKKLSQEVVPGACYICGCTCKSKETSVYKRMHTSTNGFHRQQV